MEDELVFDPSKKKKKKKKTPFDADADGEGEGEDAVTVTPPSETLKDTPDDINLDDDFSNMTKKKKKKKKPFDFSEIDSAISSETVTDGDAPAEGTGTTATDAATSSQEADVGGAVEGREGEARGDEELDLTLPFKKKKRKKVRITEGAVDMDEADGAADVGSSTVEGATWKQDSDKEYTYDELLNRAFEIMRERNPDMVAGEKKKFIVKPPQVMRVGTKKSSFSNFAEICKTLHRQPKHLLTFLLAELGTSGSIDGNNQLIIKGRFQQKQIESVLRRYIKEYVTCHTCRSPDTILQKDTRLYFLQCEKCGSRCSVTSIKSGFQAVTGKRAAIRARTT